MEKILVNSENYYGKYVAIKTADDNTIVGEGVTPQEALNKAKKNGFINPFLLYVPNKNLVHIYYVN